MTLFFNDPDLPVKVIGEKDMADTVAKWRVEAREIKDKILAPMFVEVLQKYKEGWKAAQSVKEPLTHHNVQWWWKEGDKSTRRLYDNDKGGNKQISLCQGHCEVVLKSGFFVPETQGEIVIWQINLGSSMK